MCWWKQPRRLSLAGFVVIAATATWACGGDGSGNAALMPAVEGLRLDVAISDLSAQGVAEEDVEVVGGGTFGVLDESNWEVCEQSPAAGTPIAAVRLIVDRSCGPEDSGTPTGNASQDGEEDTDDEAAAGPEPTEEPDTASDDEASQSPQPMSGVQFAVSARGDIADLQKDLRDSLEALTDGSFLRLTTNYLEMTFNLGQLQATDPPEEVSSDWNAALGELETAMNDYNTALEGDSLDGVSAALSDIEAALKALGVVADSAA